MLKMVLVVRVELVIFVDGILYQFLQQGLLLPPELISLGGLILALLAIEVFRRLWGLGGLHVYNALVLCLANIQVLHVTQYHLYPDPMPLGTVLFATLFLTNTLIVESYGAKAAKQSVTLSMCAYIFFAFSMLASLAHKPAIGGEPFLHEARLNHEAMVRVFVPSVRIFLASIASFGVSQLVNVILFDRLFHYTKWESRRWTRLTALLTSAFVDNTVFSYLAFVILTPVHVPAPVLWKGYILGSLGLRAVVIVLILGFHNFVREIARRVVTLSKKN